MIYVFTTKLEPHPTIKGKLKAVKNATECDKLVEASISKVEKRAQVRNTKAGCRTMAFRKVKYVAGLPATAQQLSALQRNPYLALFGVTKIEEKEELESDVLDSSPMEVIFSDSCIKPNGDIITLDDFPEDFSFGNGVTVGSSVPINGVGMMVLSWVCFSDTQKTKVNNKKVQLQNIMEN